MTREDERTAIDRPRPDPEPELRLASSLASAQVGELIVLDRQGQVLAPKERRWRALTSWGVWLGLSTALAVTWGMVVGSAFLGGILGAWLYALPLLRRRDLHRIQRAVALVAAGDRDRAQAALDDVLSKNPPRAFVPTLLFLRAKVEWQSGRLEQALDRYTKTMDRLRVESNANNRVMYWATVFERVQLLAVLGHAEQARIAREELADAPAGDYFVMERKVTDLILAFHEDSLDLLPDIDTLYEWAKDVLQTSQFGVAVVLLAWAFERHGDTEMVEHLLTEAPERLHATFIAESVPKVHAWMQSHAPVDRDRDPED